MVISRLRKVRIKPYFVSKMFLGPARTRPAPYVVVDARSIKKKRHFRLPHTTAYGTYPLRLPAHPTPQTRPEPTLIIVGPAFLKWEVMPQ